MVEITTPLLSSILDLRGLPNMDSQLADNGRAPSDRSRLHTFQDKTFISSWTRVLHDTETLS